MVDDLGGRPSRVVAVVQARMSSTRLPGKVLAPLGRQSVLALLARRLRQARELDDIVVATSTDPSDDPLVSAAAALELGVIRGSLHDVLGRYVLACHRLRADAVVRITADCPYSDPVLVDRTVRLWRETGSAYVTNTLDPRSFPDGFDVEVVSASALLSADRLACRPEDREHVTTFIRADPVAFPAAQLRLEPSRGEVRVTLDRPADLVVLRDLMTRVGPDASLEQVLAALGDAGPAEIIAAT